MKIHVPAGENVYAALDKIAGFLRNHVGDCEISGSGLNFYLDIDGSSSDISFLNCGSFIYEDGKFKDEFGELFSIARSNCKKEMLSFLDSHISSYEDKCRADVYHAEKQLAQAVKRKYSTVFEWGQKLAEARKVLERVPEHLDWCREIKSCILDGHVSWLVKFISDKNQYDIVSVALRPAIRKENSLVSSTVYYYSPEFNTSVIDDIRRWYHYVPDYDFIPPSPLS